MATIPVVLSCEHGGNLVPEAYHELFDGAEPALNSHRGWDPGAAELTRTLAERLRLPAHIATTTRLLVDLNRSPNNPRRFSQWTSPLPVEQRELIMQRFYTPWRQAVELQLKQAIAAHGKVVHLSIHSFTPIFNGEARNCDIGLLYDPKHHSEKRLAGHLRESLLAGMPTLRVRRNYPYTGIQDGFIARLRRHWPEREYIGIEIETSQALYDRDDRDWMMVLVDAVESSLGSVDS